MTGAPPAALPTSGPLPPGGTFRSLRNRNFRLLFVGQGLSQSGVWMHTVTTAVVVLRLTDSGLVLGLAAAAQWLPMLLLAPWGGVLADRFERRRIVFITQVAGLLVAAAMAAAMFADVASLPVVFILTTLIGIVTALEVPARISIVADVVAEDDATNAIALNASMLTGCRVVGPLLAGVIIAGPGPAWCFALHTATRVPQLWLIAAMDARSIRRAVVTDRVARPVREALRHVRERAELRVPLVLMAITAVCAFNYHVSLPLLSDRAFGTGATGYTVLFATMSLGSVLGGLVLARRSTVGLGDLAVGTLGIGVAYVVLAAAPNLAVGSVLAVPIGYFYVTLGAGTNSMLQTRSDPKMRGRVIALVPILATGLTPIGGPLTGVLVDAVGPRPALALCGAPCIVAGAVAARRARRPAAGEAASPVPVEPPPL